MNVFEQAVVMREMTLTEFAKREDELKGMVPTLIEGNVPDNRQLLMACVAFSLAELQKWKARQPQPPSS